MKPYTMEDYADEATKLPWTIDAERLKATIQDLQRYKNLYEELEIQRASCCLEMEKENKELKQKYDNSVIHATDEESQKWTAISKCSILESENERLKEELQRYKNLYEKLEDLRSHINNVIGEGWEGADATEIRSYLQSVVKESK